MRAALLAVALGAPLALSAQSGTVAGRVVRATSADAIEFATVTAVEHDRIVRAGDGGGFVFAGLPSSRTTLVARALGYRPDTVRVTVPAGDTVRVTIALVAAPITLAPVQSTARLPDRERFEESTDVGAFTVAGPMLATIPAVGEADVLRVVQMLPGVVARNDFSAGYNVRGGEADQNLVLLDGTPIYNPFHLAGLYSTFIEPAVGELTLHAGAFPAHYGGRLSSVLDVRSRGETRPGVHGTVNTSLLATSATLGGMALGTSWNLSARRTYADIVVDRLTDRKFPYHFRDLQLFGTRPVGIGDTISLSAFNSLDLFDPKDQDASLWWGNSLGNVRWVRSFGGGARMEHRLSVSTFDASLVAGVDAGRAEFRNRVRDLRAGGEATWPVRGVPLTVGYEAAHVSTTYFLRTATSDEPLFTLKQRPAEGAIFADVVLRPTKRWMIRPALRLESVPLASWTGLSPRIGAKYFVRDDIALTAAVGRHAQWLHALRNEDLPLRLLDFWVGSDKTAPVSTADHAVIGTELWPTATRFLRLEAFYKRYHNLLEWNQAEDLAVHGDEFLVGEGSSYGVDLMLRQLEVGPLSGWVSYTYGVSSRRQAGRGYFPPQDRRHTANAVASWRTGRWTLGGHFGYGSGLPYTDVVGQFRKWRYDPSRGEWVPPNNASPASGARNGSRYPIYHRLDLSLSRSFGGAHVQFMPYLQIVNTYNRGNVFTYIFDYEAQPPLRRSAGQLPLLPTFGFQVRF